MHLYCSLPSNILLHDVHKLWTCTSWILKVTSLWPSQPYCHSETLKRGLLSPTPSLIHFSDCYALLAWRFWNSIKRIYEWKWTQKFTDYRRSTHPGIKWRKWVEECVPLINPHIAGVVDSSDVPSCCSPPFLACFNKCFTGHPCPLICKWVWPVRGIGWDWRGRKIRCGHFFPISYFLHQPGVSLAQQLHLTSLLHLEACWCDHLLLKCRQTWSTGPFHEDSPTCPTFCIRCIKPPHVCLLPKGTLTDSGIQQLNDDSFIKS